jgi:peptidoglycan/LPS O-acetylase OafA/YrhL
LAEPRRESGADPAHIPSLDGVRGIAILFVLTYHFLVFGALLQGHVSSLWIDRAAFRAVSFGQEGVDLFFVLSGFLITRILLGARAKGNYFLTFYARRALRIFPAYYGFLFALIVILPQLPGFRENVGLASLRDHQLVYWTYFYNIAISVSQHPLMYTGRYDQPHFWSLAVEEQFYLVWPAVVLVLGRWRLGVFCLLCIIAAPIFRYELVHGAIPRLPRGSIGVEWLMPARLDQLAIGGLIAVISAKPDFLRKAARWAIPVGIVSALLVVVYVGRDPRVRFPILPEQVEVFGYSAVALAFASLLTMVVGGVPGSLQALCGNRVLTFFGRYSYGLYVVHYQIMQWLIQLFESHGGLPVI